MRRMKKRGPNVLFDLNDLLFFLTGSLGPQSSSQIDAGALIKVELSDVHLKRQERNFIHHLMPFSVKLAAMPPRR